jgi:hypothetical protein
MSILEAYANSQSLLAFGIEWQKSKVGKITAVFKLSDMQRHLARLSESEQHLLRVADICGKYVNLSSREDLAELLGLVGDFREIIQDQL